MANFGSSFKNQMMDGQTSGPPKPLLDFILSVYLKQLEVSTEPFNPNQTASIVASRQRHGRTDDEIYDELEARFPYHGRPLSSYEFEESIDTKKHDTTVAATKKMDIELKRVSLAMMTEYDKKGKCKALKRSEREKAMQILDITTEDAACGVLMQLDASLVVKLGNFENVSADLSPLKMLHAGK